MPSAIILHIQNMCIKSSLVNFHPFPSVMLHFKAHFPHPQTLRPNTYNSCFETNLTKVGFRNGGNCSTTITNLSHSRYVLAWTQLTTIWSFRLCTTMTFPEMRTFILTWFLMSKTFFRNWRPPMFDFFLPSSHAPPSNVWSTTNWHNMQQCKCQLYTSILTQLRPFFVLLSQIRWLGGCHWLRGLVGFKFRT